MSIIAGITLFLFGVLCTVTVAIPIPQNGTGLGAALNSLANSVVVVHDEPSTPSNRSLETANVSELHLQSVNAIHPLAHIWVNPEGKNVVAETQNTVYSNETDAAGVVKLTVVLVASNSNVTVADDDDEEEDHEDVTAETTEYESTTGMETEMFTTVATTQVPKNATSVTVITVIHSDQGDQEKEEKIKENIKEVEAMPVILTGGV
ncbi:uncharacterized protein LOC131216087 [Anopheles bellator]|uniref:uncharacterized protein LOC131216087 n=1 Tax=Anopheles bellator TaxID=139047 RepID=UPI002647FC65|nr:uncharacterized protein LOC131216087 [Anopheles bellator]